MRCNDNTNLKFVFTSHSCVIPALQSYKSDEIIIRQHPKYPAYLSFSTILNGTEVYLTTGLSPSGEKTVTAEETSTPQYIFFVQKVEE